MIRVALVLFVVACGPKQSRPKYDTARLARQLHADLAELGAIAARYRGDCPGLIPALDPHITVMRAHADEVKRVQQDTATAQQLKKDVAAYDEKNRGLAEAIGNDLGASYQTCPDDRQLLQLIDRIPEL